MNYVSLVQRIRACESEVAAQLLLEGWVNRFQYNVGLDIGEQHDQAHVIVLCKHFKDGPGHLVFAEDLTASKGKVQVISDQEPEALAQPEQEPVGKLVSDEFDGHRFISYQNEWPFNVDLYTAPPQHALMAEHWKAEYDKLKAACKPLTDKQLRKLWAQYAAKQNGWPNDVTPPVVNIGNGPRFQAHWHESEYQTFKAGFKAAHNIKE